MDESEALREFHVDLIASVTERSRELAMTKQEAFTQMALEELVEIGAIGNDFELCYLRKKLGRGIGRVTAYAISEGEARLDLFTTIFHAEEEVSTLKQKEMDEALVQASRVFRYAEGIDFEQMEPASAERLMIERLHKAHDSVTTLRLFVLTNAVAPPGLKERDVPDLEAECVSDCYDLLRHFRWKSASAPYESITIDLAKYASGPLPCLRMHDPAADYTVYMAIVPGQLLSDIYEEYGARLMELNVRSYLQNRGKVNKGIRDTILDEPHRFLAYNNGISTTAEHVIIDETSGGPAIKELHGLQIVNGGQTVASIHRAGKIDRADLSRVSVQAKVSVVPGDLVETLVPKISRFANTQNRVAEADFSANNPFHVEMEQLSRKVWTPGEQSRWFYERARGQYDVQRAREGRTQAQRSKFDAVNPKRQRFDKTDVAKWVNTWDERPYLVSLGSQKNFAAFMSTVDARPEGWLPDQAFYRSVVARGVVFKAAEAIARALAFPAYRANAVCYTVSYVVYRIGKAIDLETVWTRQSVSPGLDAIVRDWMPSIHREIVGSAAGRNVTEWAKKEACWHAIQRLDLDVDPSLISELGMDPPRARRESVEGIEDLMAIAAGSWMELHGWGERSALLSAPQLQATRDLAAYASTGWRQLPTAAECQLGIEILATARAEGQLTPPD